MIHLTKLSVAVVAALMVWQPAVAVADFRQVEVRAVLSGFGGNSTIEYVELRLTADSQIHFENTRMTAFDADGTGATELVVADRRLVSGLAGDAVLFASEGFANLIGMVPDFSIPTGVISPAGMVCWGAPGAGSAPDPASWAIDDPANYVDCLAYGLYDGPMHPGSSSASPFPPGDGGKTLVRVSSTGSDADDFALETVPVCNNSGDCTILSAVTTLTTLETTTTSTTSTSFTTTTSTTITTLEPGLCCGDANDSGSVTASDALVVLRKAVGLGVLDCPDACRR